MTARFRRLLVILGLSARPKPVMGSRPGYLWEPARRRWVPEEQATCAVYGAYTPIGPVYVPAGLQP
jgi:hypothetical protein